MPARKPPALTNWHQTKADREAREAAQAAMTPNAEISETPPSALKGHPHAAATWRRLIGLYLNVDGNIVTAFDEQLLVTYCKLIEEELNLESKVKELDKSQKAMLAKANKIKPTTDNFRDWVGMWQQINGLTANFRGMDARLDGKRKHRLALEQSLYLTPRARAAVAPPEKPAEEPESEMEKLLREGS